MSSSVHDDALRAARLYATLHTGTPGDIDFYLRVAQGAREVLELGVGAGRVLAELVGAGLDVTGVDIDPAQLTLASEAVAADAPGRVTLHQADIAALDLGRTFDRVFIPFTTLFALPSHDAIAACLAAARAHLRPDGVLAFDVYPVDDDECDARAPEETGWEPIGTVWWEGREVVVWENDVSTGEPCRVDTCYRFDLDDDDAITQRIAHCFASPSQLAGMLLAAGFTAVRFAGDFAGTRLDDESERLVVTAR